MTDTAKGAVFLPIEKSADSITPKVIEAINGGSATALKSSVEAMLLDLYGQEIEAKRAEVRKLNAEKAELETQLKDGSLLHRDYEKVQEQIQGKEKSIATIRDQFAEKAKDLVIARLPQDQRLKKWRNGLMLRSLAFLPGVATIIGSITYSISIHNGGPLIIAFFGFIFGMFGFAALADFKGQLLRDPLKYFELKNSQIFLDQPTELNMLVQQWLTQVGLKRIEEAIEHVGSLAGKWDNQAAKLQELQKQAEQEQNPESRDKVMLYIERLKNMRLRLEMRLQSLRSARDNLISMQKYDLELFAIENEIDGLGDEVEKFLTQTTHLLKRIRDTVDLALAAEARQLIEKDNDLAFEELERLLAIQGKIAAKLGS